jgi:hypothetical protein
MGDLAAGDDQSAVTMQFHTLSHVSATDNADTKSSVHPSAKKGNGLSSLSHHERSGNSSKHQETEDPRHKKAGFTPNKKLESASVDMMSDSSSKRYW